MSVRYPLKVTPLLLCSGEILTPGCEYIHLNKMRSRQLHDALEKLTKAIREVEAVVETMRTEHDPLASHIFVSRRHYRNVNDTKGGKRRKINARCSDNDACHITVAENSLCQHRKVLACHCDLFLAWFKCRCKRAHRCKQVVRERELVPRLPCAFRQHFQGLTRRQATNWTPC